MTTYSEVSVSGYNASPPEDDGTAAASNEVEWQKHLDKIGAPLKTAIESTQTNITTAVSAMASCLEGHLHGLTMSINGTDATNDIDIAAGQCRDSTNADSMVLSAITKRVDATWSVGTNQGGWDAGSVGANNTVHVFVIKDTAGPTVDVLFSDSPTSPTLPSGYDYFRRIGSFLRESGANTPFWQTGDTFLHQTVVTERQSSAALAASLFALTVPDGITIAPILSARVREGNTSIYDARDTSFTNPMRIADESSNVCYVGGAAAPVFYTNTSAQIGLSVTEDGQIQYLYSHGWVDTRGRLA